ncbi:MAG: hypothetical protein U0792_04570 [Gemmataceae bacterium]
MLRQLGPGDIEKGLQQASIAVADRANPPGSAGTLGLPRRSAGIAVFAPRSHQFGGTATALWLGSGDIWNELARSIAGLRKKQRNAVTSGVRRICTACCSAICEECGERADGGRPVPRCGGCCTATSQIRWRRPTPSSRAGDHDEALRLFEEIRTLREGRGVVPASRRRGPGHCVLRSSRRCSREAGALSGAGDLIRTRPGSPRSRRSLYFRRGWEGITAENVACGQRLLDEHLVAEADPR